MRRLLYVLMVLLLPLQAWANHNGQEDACHAAAVIGCENFEARSLGNMLPGTNVLQNATYKNNGWYTAYNGPASPAVVDSSSGGVFSGTRALQILCPEGANTCSAKAIMRQVATCYPTCYFRWYEKWSSDYVYAPMGTKNVMPVNVSGWGTHTLQNSNGLLSNYVTGGQRPQPCNPPVTTSAPCDDSINYYRNMGSTPGLATNGYFQGNQYFCLEARLTVNSSQDSFDGVMETWVDGTKVMSHSGVNIYHKSANVSTAGAYTEWWVEGYWNCQSGENESQPGKCNNQAQVAPPSGDYHPAMRKWVDNIVISSAPIGCLGAQPPQPPVDTQAPTAPIGLVVN